MARMFVGLTFAIVLLILGRTGFPLHARALRAYIVGGAGLFSSMALTYWSASFVPSGLISVMFGLTPLMASVMAAFLLGEKSLTFWKNLGTLLGFVGLSVIFLNGKSLGGEHVLAGLIVLLISVFFNAGCLVWLKRIGDDSPPLATTVGTLAVATPLFTLLWFLTGGQWPESIPWRSGASIVYLGVLGSSIAFTMYYYVIKHLGATKISLITLITPVMALLLGSWLNGESVAPSLWFGTALILIGLLAHQHDVLVPLLRNGWLDR